jgi:hypothetical protein
MNKNHLFLGISVISLVLMSLAVFNPFVGNTHVSSGAASDFYQRHPDWIWKANPQNAILPVTGDAAFPDYSDRHPELSSLSNLGQGASDYAERHPELANLASLGQGASDYFERHPELIPAAKSSVDLTDYYFRHSNNRSLP